jgi:hypothetical protein
MPTPELPTVPTGKTIVFQFRGGPRDGNIRRSDNPDEGVRGFWLISKGGMVGNRFAGMSPGYRDALMEGGIHHSKESLLESYRKLGPAQAHEYEVIDRRETTDEIVVVCEYVGVYSPPESPSI